jgi:hypothetical protein
MNKQEGRAEKNHLSTATIAALVADLRQILKLGHTGKFGANNVRIVRDLGPSVTHHYDSMVERVRIFLQTLDPHPVATRVNARLEMKRSV